MTETGLPDAAGFWEAPEMVARFAGRDPDHRLEALVDLYPHPRGVRVLDLGCAGGRNTVFLAERGFDVIAVDSSRAMVAETRRRTGRILGREEAGRRVRVGAMTDLGFLDTGSVDLLVALGVLHAARSREEWNRTLAGVFRVLAVGGRLLVANHTSRFDPEGTGLVSVPGEPSLRDGLPSGRSFLVDAETLDLEMTRFGGRPLVPTRTVERPTEAGGRRATANGLYLKP